MQTIFRVEKSESEKWASVLNETIRDERISFKATGLLVYLLSMKGDWVITQAQIAKAKKEGRDSIRAAFNELVAAGYMRQEQIREKGQIKGVLWIVSEKPMSPETAFPAPAFPAPANPTLRKTITQEDHSEEPPCGEEEDVIPEVPTEGERFADWFKTLLPPTQRLEEKWRANWARLYDQLIRLDKREPAQITAVCRFARSDSFWANNFLSPVKLRNKNKDGVTYFDVFLTRSKSNADTKHRQVNHTDRRENFPVPVRNSRTGKTEYLRVGGGQA